MHMQGVQVWPVTISNSQVQRRTCWSWNPAFVKWVVAVLCVCLLAVAKVLIV